jgi:predicted lipid-binding transport protein (Tim44 family)
VSWLIHTLGLGQQAWDAGGSNTIWLDEIAGGLLIFILGLVVVVFVRNQRKSPPPDSLAGAQSGRHKAFTNPSSLRFEGQGTATNPAQFQNYKSKNVGNDASAWPLQGYGPDTLDNNTHDAMPHYSGIPQGFDVKGFVNTAKQVFMTLQVAWDRSDMKTLHAMLTDQMLSEIKSQLNEREQQSNGLQNQTDVVTLQAELLGIQESTNEYTSSVEFSGLIREDSTQGPAPFREVWTLCRPKDGSTGWLVSGVQALQ